MMKGQKGITLVALVITIIVMLILVGVSVTVALNGGLFTTAENAVDKTDDALKAENRLDSGNVTFGTGDDAYEDSLTNYVNNL